MSFNVVYLRIQLVDLQ